MAFFACGEAFIEVITSNRIPLAGIFSRVVANASAEDNNVVSTQRVQSRSHDGHRSILASPLSKEMEDVVNDRIKHRERFRPFAGVVPLENVSDYFELDRTSPYMQFVVPVKKEAEDRIPAVVSLRYLPRSNCGSPR
jgi:hypothetical protein